MLKVSQPPNVRVDRAAVNREHHPSLANAKQPNSATVQRVVVRHTSLGCFHVKWPANNECVGHRFFTTVAIINAQFRRCFERFVHRLF
jgi:hypothetical protein